MTAPRPLYLSGWRKRLLDLTLRFQRWLGYQPTLVLAEPLMIESGTLLLGVKVEAGNLFTKTMSLGIVFHDPSGRYTVISQCEMDCKFKTERPIVVVERTP